MDLDNLANSSTACLGFFFFFKKHMVKIKWNVLIQAVKIKGTLVFQNYALRKQNILNVWPWTGMGIFLKDFLCNVS